MKILMINKFLHPNGGSETYIFKLGDCLEKAGHEVQYFGMEHEGRLVGNRIGSYTSDMDFHGGSKVSKLLYPIKTIYSCEARDKIRLVLEDFQPDVCHLNNFNYQLTPSILLEIRKWEKRWNHPCKIIYTAHDYQLVCPNHMMNNPGTHKNCEECLGGRFTRCVRGRCIHGSLAKSVVGMAEAFFWKWNGVYKHIDTIICCSSFMKQKLDSNPVFRDKTVMLHNFIDSADTDTTNTTAPPVTAEKEAADNLTIKSGTSDKKDYVLYFGRYSWEKGVRTLIKACRELPEIRFVFAGSGEYEEELNSLPNVKNVGFLTGKALDQLIREARFSVCPSECYENCPFSVMESQERATPVLGARVGGIPELITDGVNGRLFESGNEKDLARLIQEMWNDSQAVQQYGENCRKIKRDSPGSYYNKLILLYSPEAPGGGKTCIAYRTYSAADMEVNAPAASSGAWNLKLPKDPETGYVLYFGRFSKEKGIQTLIQACRELPDISFVFAGTGPMEDTVSAVPNLVNVGFQKGKDLERLIRGARFSVYPSEWYENCPFSVMESQAYGTPVLGAAIGGIPELITDSVNGRLFESGNVKSLVKVIREMWDSPSDIEKYRTNCRLLQRDCAVSYAKKLTKYYSSGI